MRLITFLLILSSAAYPLIGGTQPTGPVRLVVASPQGGLGDKIARLLGQQLQGQIGQDVIVENRPGSAGAISATLVAKASPDGQTLLLGGITTHGAALLGETAPPYDPVRDFSPIAFVGLGPSILVVHPSLPARTLPELVALARTRQLTFSTTGQNSLNDLLTRIFAKSANVNLVQIPYQ